MKTPRTLLLGLFLGIIFASHCEASTNFYVDPDWTGAHTGTASQPWATLGGTEWPAINSALIGGNVTIAASGIHSLVAATGYGVDFGWIDIPVLDPRGEPRHLNGITDVPGLYFLGLQWLSKMKSSFLSGVGDDAAVLADHIASRR